jgi:hypothetical protein
VDRGGRVGPRKARPLNGGARRTFYAGVLAGIVAFVSLLGAFKDLYALADPAHEGEFAWGYVMLRYTCRSRVWFGYRFTGDAAWWATWPHVAIYGAIAVGLLRRARWACLAVVGYLAYVVASQTVFTLFYPYGWLTGRPYPTAYAREELEFLVISAPFEFVAAFLFWRLRGAFGAAEAAGNPAVASTEGGR